jgi:hypothetical protein
MSLDGSKGKLVTIRTKTCGGLNSIRPPTVSNSRVAGFASFVRCAEGRFVGLEASFGEDRAIFWLVDHEDSFPECDNHLRPTFFLTPITASTRDAFEQLKVSSVLLLTINDLYFIEPCFPALVVT